MDAVRFGEGSGRDVSRSYSHFCFLRCKWLRTLIAHVMFFDAPSDNLAESEPEILKQMIEHWVEWEAETGTVSRPSSQLYGFFRLVADRVFTLGLSRSFSTPKNGHRDTSLKHGRDRLESARGCGGGGQETETVTLCANQDRTEGMTTICMDIQPPSLLALTKAQTNLYTTNEMTEQTDTTDHQVACCPPSSFRAATSPSASTDFSPPTFPSPPAPTPPNSTFNSSSNPGSITLSFLKKRMMRIISVHITHAQKMKLYL